MTRKAKTKICENDDIDDDEEPDFSDPEDFVDDITEEELLGDLLKQKPKETDGVESVIIVDGVPQVGEDRKEKLKTVIKKIFKDFGTIINEYYPLDEDGKTKGYIFLEFADKATAENAVAHRNNYKLDKQHTFLCNLFTDFDKYSSISDEFVAPSPLPYKDCPTKYNYLFNESAFDQYAVIYDGTKTAIYLNSIPEPAELTMRERWTDTYVRWSPHGTYLATFHVKGIALWGGDDFQQVQKFSHPGIQFIDFSPCEKYLLTFSPHDQRSDEPQSIIVWDVRTGQKKRAFNPETPTWPIFKWSHDDKYFARISDGALNVYETPSFGLLDKKSIKVPGIKGFSWSPTDNIIAYWIAEEKDVPAKMYLVSIPNREEVRTKNLFNVADCTVHWQKNGDYLCVKVDRYVKVRREKNDVKYAGIYYNFEIFHMREKGIPVDSLEIKETIQMFAWEPNSNKFAMISGENMPYTVTFYQVNKGFAPSEVKKLEKRNSNSIHWSPQGQFAVLATLRTVSAASGMFEFVDTKTFQTTASGEHFMATELEWDPTGRYVATSVAWWGHKVDNAYWIWSFQGKILRRHALDKLCHFSWRPRAPVTLPATELKELKKNMKKYTETFEVQDKMRHSKASKEIIEKQQKLMSEFQEYRRDVTEKCENDREARMRLRGETEESIIAMDNDYDEEVIEFLIKKEVKICGSSNHS